MTFKLWKGLADAIGSVRPNKGNKMKKNGVDYDECNYAEMTKSVGGQSQPQEYHDEPLQNAWEMKRWNSNGYDQSGMKGK
jgi:hypothetical protein